MGNIQIGAGVTMSSTNSGGKLSVTAGHVLENDFG